MLNEQPISIPLHAWELPWSKGLHIDTYALNTRQSLADLVQGPLLPLTVDCFWCANTEGGLYTDWNQSNTRGSKGQVELTHKTLFFRSVLNILLFHVLYCK